MAPRPGWPCSTISTSGSAITTGCTQRAAHLLEQAGDDEAAITAFRAAADRTANLRERNYLVLQAARLAAAHRNIDGNAR